MPTGERETTLLFLMVKVLRVRNNRISILYFPILPTNRQTALEVSAQDWLVTNPREEIPWLLLPISMDRVDSTANVWLLGYQTVLPGKKQTLLPVS